jgi:GDSL-like Lipase/Acylhydrolase
MNDCEIATRKECHYLTIIFLQTRLQPVYPPHPQLLVQFVSFHPLHHLSHPNSASNSGDSYTQTGFVSNGTLPAIGNPLGNPPYPGFTATGGENWIDYLTTTYNNSLVFTYNYAYGGATIDASLVTPYLPTVLSLTDQVNEFLNGTSTKPAATQWKSSDTLFSVWIGINDIGNSYYLSGNRDAYVSFISGGCFLRLIYLPSLDSQMYFSMRTLPWFRS